MTWPSYYEFLNMDLQDQNLILLIAEKEIKALEQIQTSEDGLHNLVECLRKLTIYRSLQILDVHQVFYFDNWRDKWIVKEKEDLHD